MNYVYSETLEFSDDDYREALSYVTAQRREKAERYFSMKDKKLSVSAYLVLIYGLKKEYGIEKKQEFYTNCYGKPFPVLENYSFNISHTEGGVMCSLGMDDLGCDIESCVEKPFLPENIFHKNEINLVRNATNPSFAFTRLWTLKEAWAKCDGLGLLSDLSMMDFSENIEKRIFEYKGRCLSSGICKGLFWAFCIKEDKKETKENYYKEPILVTKLDLFREVLNGKKESLDCTWN